MPGLGINIPLELTFAIEGVKILLWRIGLRGHWTH